MIRSFNSSTLHSPTLTPNSPFESPVRKIAAPTILPITLPGSSSAASQSASSMAQPGSPSVSSQSQSQSQSQLPVKAATSTQAPNTASAQSSPAPSAQSGTSPQKASQTNSPASSPALALATTLASQSLPSQSRSQSVTAATSSGPYTQDGVVFDTSFSITPFSAATNIDSTQPTTTPSTSSTPSASSSSTSNDTSTSQPLSKPGLISITVVGSVVALLVISLLFFTLRKRYRQISLAQDNSPALPLVGPQSPSPSTQTYARSPSPYYNNSNTHTNANSTAPSRPPRSIPSPIPIYSPYHDEKEVFTPQALLTPLPGTPAPLTLNSQRRPTHPLNTLANTNTDSTNAFSPFSPFAPVTPLSATHPVDSMRRSRSWNFDVTPALSPRQSQTQPQNLSQPQSRNQIQPLNLNTLPAGPETLVSPMYPLTPGANNPFPFPYSASISARHALAPISPLAGRSELGGPDRGTFGDVRWGTNSAGSSARVSRRPSGAKAHIASQLATRAASPSDTQDATVLEMSAERASKAEPVELENGGHGIPVPADPVELPASKSSPRASSSRWTSKTSSTGVGWLKRSATGKSLAASESSSRYSQASGMGDRVVGDLKAGGDSSGSGSDLCTEEKRPGRSASWGGGEGAAGVSRKSTKKSSGGRGSMGTETETDVEVDMLSILSVFDLVKSGRGSKVDK